jgi:hypothetical protein
MLPKMGIALALAAFLAVPSASFAASKAKSSFSDQGKSSFSDQSKCEGGACTAVNPDRDPNTSLRSQHYRRSHKTHKIQSKN